jgi:hypothetical protein
MQREPDTEKNRIDAVPTESRMGAERSVAAFIKSQFTRLTFVTHRSKLFLSLLLTCFANMPQDVAYHPRSTRGDLDERHLSFTKNER